MTITTRPAGRAHLSVIEGGSGTARALQVTRADTFGRLLSLRATDGAHRLGSAHSVRVLPSGSRDGRDGAQGRQVDALLRLTEHYGDWLGFSAPARSVGMGRARILGAVPDDAGRIEYRIHVRRIGRRRERLVVDGEAICDGVPILRVERIEVGRAPATPGRRLRSGAARGP